MAPSDAAERGTPRSSWIRRSLRTKVVLLLLAISVVPLAAVTSLAWFEARANLQRGVTERLLATAEGRIRQIEAFLLEDIHDIEFVSREPGITRSIEELATALRSGGRDSASYASAEKPARDFLAYLAGIKGHADVLLLSPEGRIVLSVRHRDLVGSDGSHLSAALGQAFAEAMAGKPARVSDFDVYLPTGQQTAFTASPIVRDGRVKGVAVLELGNRRIAHLVQDYVGLGETGETVIGTRVGGRVMVIAPLRHHPESAHRLAFPLGGERATPLQRACRGEDGRGLETDYRGVETLAVWRWVPSCRWGIVVKMDAREAYAPLDRLGLLFLRGAVMVAVIVIVAAILLARSIVGPVQRLTGTARGLAGGDLARRADVVSQDEIGELALAFNRMASNIEERANDRARLNRELAHLNGELTRHQEHLEEMVEARTSELSTTNRQLAVARDAAEDAVRAKSAFLANMTHELRTPLNAILGFSDLLEDDSSGLEAGERGSLLREIGTAGRRLLALVDDVLELTRLDAGQVDLNLDEVNPRSLVEDLAAGHRQKAARAFDSLTVAAPADLGTTLLDVHKTSRALQGLLDNACKFTRRGSIKVEVGRGEEADGPWLRIRVVDSGPGMARATLERMLESFTQADESSTRRHGGAGIGLALTRRLCEVMGGRLEVESELGKGSAFTIWLPWRPSPPAPPRPGTGESVGDDDAT